MANTCDFQVTINEQLISIPRGSTLLTTKVNGQIETWERSEDLGDIIDNMYTCKQVIELLRVNISNETMVVKYVGVDWMNQPVYRTFRYGVITY